MTVHHFTDQVTLHAGDCLDVLRALPDCSIDAVVTDPPYGLAEHSVRDVAGALAAWMAGDRDHVPDGRGFMGNRWDRFVPPPGVWDECLRVLKPGGHLLAFAASRTADLMGLSIRLAGFEIRDTITWHYASGFPKSRDVSKAIDKQRDDRADVARVAAWLADQAAAAGITRAQVDAHMRTSDMAGWWLSRLPHRCQVPQWGQWQQLRELIGFGTEMDAEVWRLNGRKGTPGEAWEQREQVGEGYRVRRESTVQIVGLSKGTYPITAPATDDARRWAGWGTALKPASEPIIVARKPLAGTVAQNVLTHGTGALNIGACHVGTDSTRRTQRGTTQAWEGGAFSGDRLNGSDAGRWPPNVVLSHAATPDGVDACVACECGWHGPEDEVDNPHPLTDDCRVYADCVPGCPVGELDAQSGLLRSGANPTRRSADKFRDAYGEFTGQAECTPARGADSGASRFFPTFRYQAKAPKSERPKINGVAHPTVKPLALMRWLVTLVTPPGGTVLEPFAGSGTTVEACLREGVRCVAVERDLSYLPLIEHRIQRATTPDPRTVAAPPPAALAAAEPTPTLF